MTDNYSELPLEELQKLLQERNMPTDGSREELIERLKLEGEKTAVTSTETETGPDNTVGKSPAGGNNAASATETTDAAATTTEDGNENENENEGTGDSRDTTQPVTGNTTSETETKEASTSSPSASTASKSQSPPLTKEEITKMALDLLNKKLHRANKFGMEQSEIDAINQQINRVNKFGVDLQSSLALELGLVKPVRKSAKRDPPRGNEISKNTQRNSTSRNRSRSRNRVGSRYRTGGRNRGGYGYGLRGEYDSRATSRNLRY